MNLVYCAIAACLLLLAAALDFGRPRAPPAAVDRPQQIVDLMAAAGLTPSDRRMLEGPATLLSFAQTGCAATTEVVILPSINRPFEAALRQLAREGDDRVFIYGGAEIAGFGTLDLLPGWLGRKVRTVLKLRPQGVWDSQALAVFFPKACPRPRPDWTRLDRD